MDFDEYGKQLLYAAAFETDFFNIFSTNIFLKLTFDCLMKYFFAIYCKNVFEKCLIRMICTFFNVNSSVRSRRSIRTFYYETKKSQTLATYTIQLIRYSSGSLCGV